VKYNGNSLTFDGTSNAWVSFGNAVSFGGEAFSISVRAKFTSFAQDWSRVFDFQPSASTEAGVLLTHYETSNSLYFKVMNGNNNFPSTWRLNQFDHVVLTCTPPNTCKFYFNGALVNTYTVGTLTTQTYSYVAGLGKSAYPANGYFSGEIADFRLFSRALTSDEVTAIYTGNECATSSCTAGNYFSTTSLSCVACPAGSTSIAGAYTCTCPANFYQTGYGLSLVCTACPAKSTSDAGAYICTCRNGFTLSGYGAGLTCVFSSFNSCPNASTALKADHQLFPNPSLAYAVGASVGNTLSDVGLSSIKYPITAGSGVKYNGHSLVFDGTSNAWVSFGNAVSFGGEAFSISVRAKFTSFAGVWPRVFDFQASIDSLAGVCLSQETGLSTVGLGVFGSWPNKHSAWELNKFVHYVLTCASNICKSYLNSVLVSTISVSMTTRTYSYVAGLGKSAFPADGYFSGEIADFRLFSRALTSDEVTAIYTGNECATSSCSAGTYFNTTSSSCVACPAGSTSIAGAYTCTCPANFYQTGYGSSLVCTACPAKSTSDAGAYICTCRNGFTLSGNGVGLSCLLKSEYTFIRDEIIEQISNITINSQNELNTKISNITSDIQKEITSIKNEIAKINSINQKLSSTLTKLRKTYRKNKTEL
jgi:hypothetical protein